MHHIVCSLGINMAVGAATDVMGSLLYVSDSQVALGCVLQTWGNRADAFVRQAELMAESNAGQGREQAYEQGMEAYATACSLSSSEQGDDLPGLLHNWGVGLRSMAEHTLVRPSSAALCIHMCSCQMSVS